MKTITIPERASAIGVALAGGSTRKQIQTTLDAPSESQLVTQPLHVYC